MAKIRYDNTGVEDERPDRPKPGLYKVKIESVEHRTNRGPGKDDDLAIVFRVDDGGDYDGAPLYSYVSLGEAAAWKFKEFTKALGMKEKGELETGKLKNKRLNVRVIADSYNDEYTPRVGRFLKLGEGSDDETDPEETSEAGGNGNGDDGDFVPTREDDENSYDDWDDSDIEGEFDDRGLDLPGGRGKKRDKWIKALRADDEEQNGGTNGNGGGEGDDYDDWSLEDLIDEAKNTRKLDMPRGRKTKDMMIELLREDDNSDPFEGS